MSSVGGSASSCPVKEFSSTPQETSLPFTYSCTINSSQSAKAPSIAAASWSGSLTIVTPTLDRSRSGLITTGSVKSSLIVSWSGRSAVWYIFHFGTSKSDLSYTVLVLFLLITIALDAEEEPVNL